MRWLLLVVMAVGCGEGGEGETRVPEDYLPEGVDISGLTEAQQVCVLHLAVGYARVGECDPEGPFAWGASPTPEEWVEPSLFRCTMPDITMDIYNPPAQGEHVARCLDFRAAAPCGDLAREEQDVTFKHCELVSPSW